MTDEELLAIAEARAANDSGKRYDLDDLVQVEELTAEETAEAEARWARTFGGADEAGDAS